MIGQRFHVLKLVSADMVLRQSCSTTLGEGFCARLWAIMVRLSGWLKRAVVVVVSECGKGGRGRKGGRFIERGQGRPCSGSVC